MTFLIAWVVLCSALNLALAVGNARNSRRNAANARANAEIAAALARQTALWVKPQIKVDVERFRESMNRAGADIERSLYRLRRQQGRRPLS